ncbi:MAG: HEAT repeat domain-containing protein [Bacteroidota bacterium]
MEKYKRETPGIDYEMFRPEIRPLIENLENDSGVTRQSSREKLVSKGNEVVDDIAKLIDAKKKIIRWEAAKTLEGIATEQAIGPLIELLEDKLSDIRWIAAIGLIKIGEPAVRPLLEAIIDKSDSYYLDKGAHHVLKSLENEELRDKLKPVIGALKNKKMVAELAPVEAKRILNELYYSE